MAPALSLSAKRKVKKVMGDSGGACTNFKVTNFGIGKEKFGLKKDVLKLVYKHEQKWMQSFQHSQVLT